MPLGGAVAMNFLNSFSGSESPPAAQAEIITTIMTSQFAKGVKLPGGTACSRRNIFIQ